MVRQQGAIEIQSRQVCTLCNIQQAAVQAERAADSSSVGFHIHTPIL